MRTELRGITYDIIDQGHGNPILLLHGFTGSATWIKQFPHVHNRLVAPSLMQHGTTDSCTPARACMSQQISDLSCLLDCDDRPWTVIGYSLGGRIGMTLAACDERVHHFIGVSTTPGLRSAIERKVRRRQDEALARLIEQEGIESFVRKWENLPLWHQTEMMKASLRKERLAQRPYALADSLRAIGTGHMPSLWGRLHQLPRTDLIVGQYDLKFRAIAEEMKSERADIQIHEISEAGHAPHIENTQEFGTIVKKLILGGI